MSLTVIVPSKGRPDNVARLVEAVNATADDVLDKLVIAVDPGEPLTEQYEKAVRKGEPGWDWIALEAVEAQPQRMGPVLNAAAVKYAGQYDHVGFMGDDHFPRTPHWDTELVASLGGGPGIAYGNDLAQGEALPTACAISSDIIRALGYMCPPAQEHLYLDDFWKRLGLLVGNLAYRGDVVIEHLHPNYGKARWDDGYAGTNSADQYSRDRAAYAQFDWEDCLARLRAAGIALGPRLP